ncbi:MAG: electron transfer flavoprotein subunit alpha/FixB family protein [Actinomyces sp.]|uniref:electron transfer flavoprotein subunit alpha/FixB family protein n=1 Tax=Actinomyces sp. TaxID=29317 RepID=UPI0026DB923D|nr:electron transfer flavoprotein subunit alpha/FixB family protein [Actinomyces sp.]MDO4243678.1 electron transfer flavoprotein subunit alpha/FixB family protein [Actinomyces sp.]
MIDAPVLVLADLDAAGAPTAPALELISAARTLTSGEVTALVLAGPDQAAAAGPALSGCGAVRVLAVDPAAAVTAAGAADAVVAAVGAYAPGVVLVTSDYRGKEIAGRAAVLLDSACASDVADLEIVGEELRASKLVLSGSWTTTLAVAPGTGRVPVVAVRPGAVEAAPVPAPSPAPVEQLAVELSPEASAVTLVSSEQTTVAAGPDLVEARTVVVGGRGVDGDFDLVRSLAEPLGAAVGATRVACDEGWIERSAQVGQTGVSIAPRLYIGLGVSGAVHHTSGIQGAGTIVAICDDSEAPIFEMADFGVVGDVTQVVPQLVEELERLRP